MTKRGTPLAVKMLDENVELIYGKKSLTINKRDFYDMGFSMFNNDHKYKQVIGNFYHKK